MSIIDGPDTFDMDELTTLLVRRGVSAYVQQTGGGCATVYIGNIINDYYEMAAGPGWFNGPAWTLPRARWGDFYYGPDDDGDTIPDTVTDPMPLTDLADLLLARLHQLRAERNLA